MQVMINKFYVHNVGDLPVSMAWKMPSLFSVHPLACEDLQPGQTCAFDASFVPSEAAVFTGSAICSLSTGSSSIMRVTAIGKYPYLSVEPATVDHGQVLVGANASSSVTLLNQSLVPANFTVTDDLPTDDQVFRLIPVSGCIPPGKGVDLKLLYNPRFLGAASAVHYSIKTPGGNMVTLKQSGSALGATVALTDSSLGFGDILVGNSMRKVCHLCVVWESALSHAHQAISRHEGKGVCGTPAQLPFVQVFVLENQSSVNVPFTTLTPGHGVFTVVPAIGVLRPYMSVQCVVTFVPVYACNYWKRLSVILANTEPLDIDLIGTGYTAAARPPPLLIDHVDAFLRRTGEGGLLLPPAQAEASHYPNTPCATIPPSVFGFHSWDVIFNGQDVASALRLSSSVLEFASTRTGLEPQTQVLSVTNTLPFVVTACVHVPNSVAPGDSRKREAAWRVTPETFDVGPGESVELSVSFTPPCDGEYITDNIEIVAFVKYMRNFRLCMEVWPSGSIQ